MEANSKSVYLQGHSRESSGVQTEEDKHKTTATYNHLKTFTSDL